jgi:hypothetical protein
MRVSMREDVDPAYRREHFGRTPFETVRAERPLAAGLGDDVLEMLDDHAARLGYKTALLIPTGNRPEIRYALHLGCESDELKALNPTFWNSPIGGEVGVSQLAWWGIL